MQFFLSVYNPAGAHDAGTVYESEAEMLAAFERVNKFNTELQEAGAWITAAGLLPPEQGNVVNPSGEVSPGPLATASHHLGGYWIIEADTEEIALDWAKKAAFACGGQLELRQLQG